MDEAYLQLNPASYQEMPKLDEIAAWIDLGI